MSSMRRASRPIEQRQHVIAQVARDRQLAAVERRVAQTVDAVLGLDLQRDEVRPGLQTMTLASVIRMR